MLTEPFRGSAAVAAGQVTFRQLGGPRFRRLFPDVYLAADVEVDFAVRSRAAYLLVAGHGALGGWSAAELLGASCGPLGAPAEVVVTSGHRRALPGLRVRHVRLAEDETTTVDGVLVTSPLRTAFDLAREVTLVEGVVAVDALARVHRFAPTAVSALHRRYLGARGSRRLGEVLRLADPRSGSPMETRIRLALVHDRLPVPVLQHPVGPFQLDLAYPPIRLGVEHDGPDHRTPERARRDLDRQAYLSAAGWTVLRFPAADVFRPIVVANRVRRELVRYGRRHDRTFTEVLGLIDRGTG